MWVSLCSSCFILCACVSRYPFLPSGFGSSAIVSSCFQFPSLSLSSCSRTPIRGCYSCLLLLSERYLRLLSFFFFNLLLFLKRKNVLMGHFHYSIFQSLATFSYFTQCAFHSLYYAFYFHCWIINFWLVLLKYFFYLLIHVFIVYISFLFFVFFPNSVIFFNQYFEFFIW